MNHFADYDLHHERLLEVLNILKAAILFCEAVGLAELKTELEKALDLVPLL